MLKPLRACSSFLLIVACLTTAGGQNKLAEADQPETMTVTAAASADQVRFTAQSAVVQLRLEIYNAAASKVFDSEFRGGNVLDWNLRDDRAQSLADDTYLCVVTIKGISGRITERIGWVTIQKSSAIVQPIEISQITTQQSEAIGHLPENGSLTVLNSNEIRTTTVISHNGDEGQITSSRGAISFRIGDLYNGKDAEQMRLTPEGNLGIGITHPTVKLDVDGLIRARQGIVFPDGSVQFSAARRTFGASSVAPGQSPRKLAQGNEIPQEVPATSGTGTTGKIPRWQDGPNGVLADSNITELSGAIGMNGVPDSRFRLDVNGSTRITGSNPGFNLEGLRPVGNIWVFQTVDDDGRFRLFGQDNINPGVERLTISLSTGNVGIGNTNPSSKLDVAGNINTLTQYNIGGARVLSAAGTNLFAGVGAGVNNTSGFSNSFFGRNSGLTNTTGDTNSFFGEAAGGNNTSGSSNSFFGKDAGAANTTGGGNSFIGFGAGLNNEAGVNNVAIGYNAGRFNTSGSNNSFFGTAAGVFNTIEHYNTFIGYTAIGQGGVTNATAIGALAKVTQSNSLVLGSISGINNAFADTNVGIGTTSPTNRLHVAGSFMPALLIHLIISLSSKTLRLEPAPTYWR